MSFANDMIEKAQKIQGVLVLPEGCEKRTIQAARKIKDQDIAKRVILVGAPEEIQAAAKEVATSLEGIEIENPETSDKLDEFAAEYYELRKKKGMTPEQARVDIKDKVRWGAMMVRLDYGDAMVAGAESTTADMLRAAFTIIKCKSGVRYASSCFVMVTDKEQYGANGSFIFGDCATIPNPTAEQLSDIAIQSAQSCRTFLDVEPKVALLSYSTAGSAKGELVEKVQNALKLAKEAAPSLAIDGELQLDASIDKGVAAKKAPGSCVAGNANTLIFPDLQAGNIGYKLVQRLAGAEAYGPILQGFAKPVSDLSRGCSVDDIVITSAITLGQKQ